MKLKIILLVLLPVFLLGSCEFFYLLSDDGIMVELPYGTAFFQLEDDYLWTTWQATAELLGTEIRCYDMSDPTSPDLISTFSPTDYSVGISEAAVYGESLFVLFGGEMKVYDISNKNTPRELNQVDTPPAQALAFSGNLLVTGAGSVFDITVPANPFLISEIPLDSDSVTLDVELMNSIAFMSTSTGLKIFDLSDPAAPSELVFAEIVNNAPASGDPFSNIRMKTIIIGDSLFYLFNNQDYNVYGFETKFRVFDISNKSNMQLSDADFPLLNKEILDISKSGDNLVLSYIDTFSINKTVTHIEYDVSNTYNIREIDRIKHKFIYRNYNIQDYFQSTGTYSVINTTANAYVGIPF